MRIVCPSTPPPPGTREWGPGREALRAGLVDRECSAAELLPTADALARGLLPPALKAQHFRPASFATMKRELYGPAYQALLSGADAPLLARL